MANLLKLIEFGNPLYNLGMIDQLEQYNEIQTDEDHVAFLHHLLDISAGNKFRTDAVYSMCAFAVGNSLNVQVLIN